MVPRSSLAVLLYRVTALPLYYLLKVIISAPKAIVVMVYHLKKVLNTSYVSMAKTRDRSNIMLTLTGEVYMYGERYETKKGHKQTPDIPKQFKSIS